MIIYYFNKITNADKFCLQASYTRGVYLYLKKVIVLTCN